jgi:alpha-tubulin suppressor-like RCC1 family protein
MKLRRAYVLPLFVLGCACSEAYNSPPPVTYRDAGTAFDAATGNEPDGGAKTELLGTATAITAGYGHTCALLAYGPVKCWGFNTNGQLGQGDTDYRGDNPGEVVPGKPNVPLSNSLQPIAPTGGNAAFHLCALLTGGVVKCWGLGKSGQLGLGDTSDRGSTPGSMGDTLPFVDLGPGVVVAELALGGAHTCARFLDGRVKCWGDNAFGQLGLGDKTSRGGTSGSMGSALPFVDLGTGAKALSIAAGPHHTCVRLDTNKMKCWGDNQDGQLGLGDRTNRGDAPNEMGDALPTVDVGSGRTVRAMSLGSGITCALLDAARVKCWGVNPSGQLGLGLDPGAAFGGTPGTMGDALPYVDLGTNQTVDAISAGANHVCALVTTGQVKCWGSNYWGQLGIGSRANRGVTPIEMGDALPFVSLGTGRRVRNVVSGVAHVCALLDDGGIKCWGYNSFGQLGVGDAKDRGVAPWQMGDSLPYVDLR